jgi:hypothetical protein
MGLIIVTVVKMNNSDSSISLSDHIDSDNLIEVNNYKETSHRLKVIISNKTAAFFYLVDEMLLNKP